MLVLVLILGAKDNLARLPFWAEKAPFYGVEYCQMLSASVEVMTLSPVNSVNMEKDFDLWKSNESRIPDVSSIFSPLAGSIC